MDPDSLPQTRAVPPVRGSLPPVASRWQKGQLTFGPVGRIGWTVAILLVPLVTMTYGGPGGVVFDVMWIFIVAPLALRDIWQRATVYVPVPPRPADRSMTSADGAPLPSLSEYVAGQSSTPLD